MAKLETSKVHDAYRQGGECPFCWLLDEAERSYVGSFRGHRVMTPESRIRTNEAGFCPAHFQRLYGDRDGNQLGLALMTRTHLERWLPELKAALAQATPAGAGERRGHDRWKAVDDLGALLTGLRDRCAICDLLSADLDRYCFTVVYLWKHDPDFAPTLAASRGFCLSNLPPLLASAEKGLSAAELARFLRQVLPMVASSLERLDRELGGFIDLSQATSPGLGTEAERTALARALEFLSGRIPRKE